MALEKHSNKSGSKIKGKNKSKKSPSKKKMMNLPGKVKIKKSSSETDYSFFKKREMENGKGD